MPETATHSETFQHRKRKFEIILDQLTDPDADVPSHKSNARREENEERLHTLVMAGALPWKGTYHPTGYSETWGIHGDYFLQIFFSTGEDIINDDLTADDVRERIEEKHRILDEGIGKPSATDGSKGQWRAAHKNAIKAYQWFLGEWDGTDWMHDPDISRQPDDWNPEPAEA